MIRGRTSCACFALISKRDALTGIHLPGQALPGQAAYQSRVGIAQAGRVEIIPDDQGNRITSGWVDLTDNGRPAG
jgi:hypothetical protein